MKQKLLLLAMGLFAAIGTIKADRVYFSTDKVDVKQGKSAKVTICYDADGSIDYTAFQVEFILPEGLSVISAEIGPQIPVSCPGIAKVDYNPKREADGASVFLGVQTSSLDPLPTGEGVELFSFFVQADENCEIGEYPVETTKIEFAGRTDKFENQTIIYNVIPNAARVLEDTDTDLPVASETPEDVVVKRSVKAGNWSTICLPFDMTEAQLKENFGEGVQLADFTSTSWSEEKENVLIVNFTTVSPLALEANHPYVLKSEKDVEEIAVSNVEVNADEEEAYLTVKTGKGKNEKTHGVFHGTLKAGEVTADEPGDPILYIRDNKFYYVTSTNMKAYRGFFEFYDFDASEGANVWFAIDGETTAIDGVNIRTRATGDVYNMNGMYMGRAEDVMNSLPRGIYVINNKKVVVK